MFTTIESSLTKSGRSLALFGKEWRDISNDMRNAKGWGRFDAIFSKGLSNDDVNRLKEYNNLIAKGQNPQSAYYRTLKNASSAAQNLAMNANGAAVSQQALDQATRTSTIALKAQQIAMNLLANAGLMVIITLISKGVKAFGDLINHVEITREKVDELTSTFKTELDTANSNAKRIEDLADKYEELSKGVNNLGENVSLTNEEYVEYNSLVNEIADMFPTLVQGYTDEGNAILNLKGNIEELRDAYKEAQQEAYNLLLVNGEDSDGNNIIKQWNDLYDTGFWANIFDFGADDIDKGISISEAIEQLKAIQNMTAEQYREIERIAGNGGSDELSKLSDIELDIAYGSYLHKALGLTWNISDEDFAKAKRQAKVLVQTYNAEIKSALTDVETLANAYLMTNEDYAKLDDQAKTAASKIVNSLNSNVASQFKTKEDVGTYVDEIVNIISSNPNVKNAMIGLFTMDTSDMPVGDIEYWTNEYINTIATILNEDPVELKIRLGIEDNQPLVNKVKGFLKDEFDDKADDLTLGDLQIAANLDIPPDTQLTWEELRVKIEEVKSATQEIILTDLITQSKELKESLDDTFSNQSTIQSALDKIRECTSLTADEVRELVELCPSLADEFEKTADGWTIGTDKLISANGNMVQNTKDSLREQLGLLKTQVSDFEEEYQSLIDSGDYSKGREFYFANIEQIEEAEETITALELTLSMFGLTTEDTTDKVNEFAEMVEKVSKKTSIISTAVEEMNDTGYISASTYADMVEQGGNFAECLEIQDGRIVLNLQKLKELEIEELRAEQAANDLALAQYKLGISSQVEAEALDEIIKKHDEKNAFIESQIQDILDSFNNDGGSSEDLIKAAFEDDMRMVEHWRTQELISDEEYLNALEKANNEYYKNSAEHYDDYLANIEKIYNGRKDLYKEAVDEEIAYLEQQYEKGFITALEYQSKLTALNEKSYGMGTLYYDTEFATENYDEIDNKIADIDSDVYEEQLKELEKANDGSIESERQFIEKWKSLNEQMFKDTDPKKYKENLEEIAEYEDDWLVRRVENEKTYWENLKQEVEDYYDKEIEKLQSILDEEEKINKQEELRNNLIKARQDLENAKKNRNQLVFVDGHLEYREDQDAVRDASESVDDAELAIKEYETEQKIAELEAEQDAKLKDIDDVINRIEQYLKQLNGETDPTVSDTEVIVSANAVEEVKKAKNNYNNISEINNGSNTTVTPEEVGKVFTDSTTEWKEQFANVLNVLGLANANLDAMKNFFTGDTHLQTMSNPSTNTIGGQVVYNNSTVNNNNSVVYNIGDVNVYSQGTSSEEILKEVASKMHESITRIGNKIIYG